jgi:hypothetical protein
MFLRAVFSLWRAGGLFLSMKSSMQPRKYNVFYQTKFLFNLTLFSIFFWSRKALYVPFLIKRFLLMPIFS